MKIHIMFEGDAEHQKKHKRIKIKEDNIYVYDPSVTIDEVLPHIIKKNRCKKQVPHLNISWSVI